MGKNNEPVMDRLDVVMRSIDRAYERYAKSCGMTYISLEIFDAIYEGEGKCTQKSICETSYYPKQTVNAIIKQFLNEGLIEMKELPEDRRHKGISLTEKGISVAEEKLRPIEEADRKAMGSFSENEKEIFLCLAERYASIFTDHLQKNVE